MIDDYAAMRAALIEELKLSAAESGRTEFMQCEINAYEIGFERGWKAARRTGFDVDALANFIRFVDGNHTLGAGALAEKIANWNDPTVTRQ